MSIRKGIDAIQDRNKVVDERKKIPRIPEIRLYEDADVAVVRFLTDEPLDVDFHVVLDEAISRAPQYLYCSKGESGECEMCNNGVGNIKRMMMFWVYVYKILHSRPDPDGNWVATTAPSGNKTVYQEDVNEIRLFRYTLGRSRYLWKSFVDLYEEFGTWKDRDYLFKRDGDRGDPNTTYKVTPMRDKTPMKKEIISVIGKLPSLESIARGIAKEIDLSVLQKPVQSTQESKSERKATQSSQEAESEQKPVKAKAKVESEEAPDHDSMEGEEEPEISINIDEAISEGEVEENG